MVDVGVFSALFIAATLLKVEHRGFNGVLREHATVQFDGRQSEVRGDVGVR